jgi:guanylate kinase
MSTARNRFVVLSGPSCVGKGPLQAAVERLYPGLLSARPVLCTSRAPRDGEIHGRDFYFLPQTLISSLAGNPDWAVQRVRSDWQAIDMQQVKELVSSHPLVFAEVFYTFGDTLKRLAVHHGLDFHSVFLLPLPLSAGPELVRKVMREKLERRGTETEPKLSERAGSAVEEVRAARSYTHYLLNPAGEDDIEEWGELGTRKEAKRKREIRQLDDLGPNAQWLVETFVSILKGDIPPMRPGDILAPPSGMPKISAYKICFADSYPYEPGSGGPDNNFYEEYPYKGTYAEVEEEARRISWEIWQGDFVWWIEEETERHT